MRRTCENRTVTTAAPSVATALRPTSDVRVAAVVEAAYILEARTR
jgi:hypothetical protein